MQHRGGQPDAGELRHAEVADDGRISKQEQRLGDQCPECRHREAQDVAPVPGASWESGCRGSGWWHGSTLAGVAGRARQPAESYS